MEGPKPQYVEVAEVLGWTYCGEDECGWEGEPPVWHKLSSIRRRLDQHVGINRYDTDWSASGPLIEKLEIDITKHRTGKWEATAWLPVWFRGAWKNPECVTGIGVTPLLAFCDLMLRLKREPEVLQEVLKRLES